MDHLSLGFIRVFKIPALFGIFSFKKPFQKRRSQTSSSGLVEFRNQNAAILHGTWQSVWLAALDRQRAIDAAIEDAEEEDFSFDEWRKKYMKWMKHKKSRVMEMMRSMDTNGSGYINNINFIRGVCESGFETNEREMYQVKIDTCDKSTISVNRYFRTISIFGDTEFHGICG